ncbi:MAG: prolyl oligopeptidase family serine peptidase [Phycisphaerales bacterium]|nr:prolyl oligopeptidase family serine peptidase [Phycisphaerales bacterium]
MRASYFFWIGARLTLIGALGASITTHEPPAARPADTVAVSPDPEIATGFLNKSIEVGGATYRYVVYVPRGYVGRDDAAHAGRRRTKPDDVNAKGWPCITFLHGGGECGTDGLKQIAQGLGSAIQWNESEWPFIVIFPQKPDGAKPWEDYDTAVMAMLAAAKAEYAIDSRRLYLTGLSQGGHGTWYIAANHPDVFAAIAPICGYIPFANTGEPDEWHAGELARKLGKLPQRIFHGLDDNVVAPEHSKAVVTALRAAGAGPEATFYPRVNHNSWDRAYREEKLAEWFLKHKR